MRFNYGVVRTIDDGVEMFSVHEIYHVDTDGPLWTEKPTTFDADSIADLEVALRTALKAVVLVSHELQRERVFVDGGGDTG